MCVYYCSIGVNKLRTTEHVEAHDISVTLIRIKVLRFVEVAVVFVVVN